MVALIATTIIFTFGHRIRIISGPLEELLANAANEDIFAVRIIYRNNKAVSHRRIFSKLLANDIVSVQAMNLPVGKLFFIKPVTSERYWDFQEEGKREILIRES